LLDDHEPEGAEIMVDARLASPVGPTPLRFARLGTLPSLHRTPVREDLDLLVR
jgi:hypothetical protein